MNFEKNQYAEVVIEDIGSEGEGIGKVDGFPLFVKDAVVGDRVRVKIIKAKKNYAFARLEEVLEESPDRIQPPCPHYRACGGCQIQQLSYGKQLEYKQKKVWNDLVRIGGFTEEVLAPIFEPIVGMEDPWRYRNKAQYPFGRNRVGEVICGFYAGRTHSIIANTDCLLGAAENEAILRAVLSYVQKSGCSIYDETTGKGLLRHVLIRKSRQSGELMVCLIINGTKMPQQELLIREVTSAANVTSISININTQQTNVILGKETLCISGNPTIEDSLYLWEEERTDEAVTYRISPNSFYQVNPVQTEHLYSLALGYAGLTGQEIVWDLYCGIGTISLFLASHAKKVYGVEIVPQAIEDAKKNAAANHLENTEFYVGKAEEVLPEWFREHGERADVIVVDPPRKGCDEKCLETIVEMAPERVVYVSCDPATLARDLKILCAQGFSLQHVRPVDMFPHTVHVETVCLLSKLHEAKHHINVKVDMDELDLTSAEAKATYKEIEEWVQEHYGFHVTNLNIAQVKQKHGIIERENYNKPKSEDSKQPGCPEEKVKAIEDAMRHFQMIK